MHRGRWRISRIGRQLLALLLSLPTLLDAETGSSAWLRYAPPAHAASPPAVIVTLSNSPPVAGAGHELVRGIRTMLGQVPRLESAVPPEDAIVAGTLDQLRNALPSLSSPPALAEDGFWLKTVHAKSSYTVIAAPNDRGVLYGAFAWLRKVALGESIADLDEVQSPAAPIRWINQWDNLDGSIERGYGGRSIFWDNGRARADLGRVSDYGRLLASLGIEACAINNVNANPRALASDFLPEIARIAAAFRPWGVRVALSVDFGSPKSQGGLDTFDPLDRGVAAWWQAKADEVYRMIPDLAGFVMKADSEGRVGPSAYGRTHADAANTVARALRPHGGLLLYRAFVYDHHMDWRNLKNDRARAAYDNFAPLDGKFDDNVVIQIKNGPIDFQVREPASPLFGALEKTNKAIELQITQEYFGQARHLVFLVPYWKDTLDFDLRAGAGPTPVKSLARAFTGVANVGLDDNWCGNHLSQANLYGFGRLAWNPGLTARRIAEEWTRLTFGEDPQVTATVPRMLLDSWRVYEDYTGPLGLQTLTDITGDHYGVAVEASERNGWGQWHRADSRGVGMDRTVATGTGFTGQYRAPVGALYESPDRCPDDLLLFFHHVPYTHVLRDGKTVIQYLYDSHYAGAARAAQFVAEWKPLGGHIDDQRYAEVLSQLEYQAGQAEVWRDAVVNWFHRESGIADDKGRVGNHPGRIEGESMRLDGYTVVPVTPWEAASGGKAISCSAGTCTAAHRFAGEPGWYDVVVQYFDMPKGVARFRVWRQNQLLDEWPADAALPARKLNASASTRRSVTGVALRPGDEIRIEGTPDGNDPAALDYIEILHQR